MVVRMRHTRGHTRNRRSHHALGVLRLSACKDCGTMNPPHLMCRNCGKYNGRVVIDTAALIAKKAARRNRKERELGKVKVEKEDETTKR